MNQEQMHGLRKAMQRFGYLAPIVIDQDTNKIADGEHRALIYKEFQMDEIPAYKVKFEDDTERRLLRQTMNKLRGQHDLEMDAQELTLIYESQKLPDLSLLIAQDEQNLKELMLKYNSSLPFGHEDDEQIDQIIDEQLKRQVPDTQLGDIYQLGNHRLICADCTDKRSMDRLLEMDKVAQLNTDPPYGVDYASKNEWYLAVHKAPNRIKTPYFNDEVAFDFRPMFNSIFQSISWAEYNTAYIWSAGQHLHEIRLAMEDSGMHWGSYLIWLKNNHVLGRHDYNHKTEYCIYGWKGKHKFYGGFRTDVLEYDKPLVNDLHPTMKPIALIRQTITDGTKQGDIVLDCFGGSGSSLIASEATGRSWRGIELDPHYCDVIVKRWEAYTGNEKKAIKLS